MIAKRANNAAIGISISVGLPVLFVIVLVSLRSIINTASHPDFTSAWFFLIPILFISLILYIWSTFELIAAKNLSQMWGFLILLGWIGYIVLLTLPDNCPKNDPSPTPQSTLQAPPGPVPPPPAFPR